MNGIQSSRHVPCGYRQRERGATLGITGQPKYPTLDWARPASAQVCGPAVCVCVLAPRLSQRR